MARKAIPKEFILRTLRIFGWRKNATNLEEAEKLIRDLMTDLKIQAEEAVDFINGFGYLQAD